ncbi:MAG: O-antigen polymerase [Stenotrophobium sp.]
MIFFVALVLGLLLAANHAVSRNLLYPPTVFTGVWLLSIVALIFSGDAYYPVSGETLMVYLIGAMAFSAGGFVILAGLSNGDIKRSAFTAIQLTRRHRVLDFVLLMVVIGLPFYLQKSTAGVDLSDPMFWANLRTVALEVSDTSQRSFDLVNNLAILSIFLAMSMHYENDGTFPRKWRCYLAILLALIYGAAQGTKGNVVTLILTLVFISSMRAGRLNFVVMGSAVLLSLAIFTIALAFSNFAYMDLQASVETLKFLAENTRDYWLGGVVAFDHIVHDPNSIPSTQKLSRFFLETANGFGANFQLPNNNPAFTNISESRSTNVYTIYCSYFKIYGWFGVASGLSMLGVVLTWVYAKARKGNPGAILFYGANITGLVLSVQAGHFVLALNFYIKMLIFFCFVYYGSALFRLTGSASRIRRHA